MLAFFGQQWLKRPLTGFGPGRTPELLQAAGNTFARLKPYRHLHNSYLQILLETGLIGFMFYLLLFSLLIVRLRGRHDRVADWLKGSLMMLAFFAFFNHPIDSHQGPTVIALLTGLVLAGKPQTRKVPNSNPVNSEDC